MAVLYISEFTSTSVDHGRGGSAAYQPSSVDQTIAIGGGSLASTAFLSTSRMVRLHCDIACSIKFGTNPTATTSTARMAANQTEYFQIPETGTYKVAVIAN